MSLSSVSIKRPVFTIVVNLVLILFGIIGFTFLGVREYPSIDPAIVSVRTSYAGANADIIESQITEPIERTSKMPPMMCGIRYRKRPGACRKILMHHRWYPKQMPMHSRSLQ